MEEVSIPKAVKRGIHVELDPVTGKFKGLPDQWKDSGLLPASVTHGVGKVDISALQSNARKIDADFHTGGAAARLYASFDKGQEGLEQMTAEEIASAETVRIPCVQAKTVEKLRRLGSFQTRERAEHRVHVEVQREEAGAQEAVRVIRGLPAAWVERFRAAGIENMQLEEACDVLSAYCQTAVSAGSGGKIAPGGVRLTRDELRLAGSIFREVSDPRKLFTDFKLIGKGAQGRVYRARNAKNNRVLAVKIIQTQGDFGRLRQAIQRETTLQWLAKHPNIIELHSVLEAPGQFWLVQELATLGSLQQLIQKGIPDEIAIGGIMKEILCALEHLHNLRIVFRDLKASNILLTRFGRKIGLKLSDFGAAAQLTPQLPRRSSIVGTSHWMSPEVVRGEPYSTEADVWSVGITALEIYSGKPPHSDDTALKAAFLTATEGPGAFPTGISEDFRAFLDACFKTPAQRPSCTELLKFPFALAGNIQALKEYLDL